MEETDIVSATTFSTLGVADVLCEACLRLKWTKPTKIQEVALPLALEGKDIIGLAETGSGKTGAFAIPIIQALMVDPRPYFAIVLTPTRELALQIQEQFTALGSSVGLSSVCLVGGLSMSDQALQLKDKKHHIVIATPGRFIDHVRKTKGFDELQLRNVRYLVIDEADRMLGMDFESALDKVLRVLPRERVTFMFSATMTDKVGKLQRASLRYPIKVTANSKYQAVSQLDQFFILIPKQWRDVYLSLLIRDALHLDEEPQQEGEERASTGSVIIFTRTRQDSLKVNLILKELEISCTPLNGDMPQNQRLGALNKFKARATNVLVATDVAARGLDIPHVDLVINYDLPDDAKTYMHRVGRTARAGRAGRAITLVTQYSVVQFTAIEQKLGKKMSSLWKDDQQRDVMKNRMMAYSTQVLEAVSRAVETMRDMNSSRGKNKSRKRTFTVVDNPKAVTKKRKPTH